MDYPGPYYAIPQGGGYLWGAYLTRLDEKYQVSWELPRPEDSAQPHHGTGNNGIFFCASKYANSENGLLQLIAPNGSITKVTDPDMGLNAVYIRAYALHNGWGLVKKVNDELHFAVYDKDLNKLNERQLPDDILHCLMYSNIIFDGTASYLVAQINLSSVNSSTHVPTTLRIIEADR